MAPLPDVSIEDARPVDRADVVRLLAQQLTEHDVDLGPDQLSGAVIGMLTDARRGRILVARDGATIIGVAVLAYTWTLEHGGQSCWLDELYVEPRYRAHGVGTKLLRAVYARAEEDGCIAMDLEVEANHARAANLYLREGFRAHTRSRFVRPLIPASPTSKAAGNVFDLLDRIRARPGMYVTDRDPLSHIESMMFAYDACLSIHGMTEAAPSMSRAFGTWLALEKGWSLSCGWADAIMAHCPTDRDPVALLFELLDAYRQLTPRVVLDAWLAPQHQPTGRRVVIGHATRMARPDRVQVLRYHPAPLHVLRLFYPDKIDDTVLLGPQAARATTLDDAKAWLADELQLGPGDWSP